MFRSGLNPVLAFSPPPMLYLWKKMEVYRMDSFFSSSTLFNIVLAVIWFISGIRDFQGKDPQIGRAHV